LTAIRIWEPTAKEIPNAAPGQRLPLNFYHHGLVLQGRRVTPIG
jgi:hypothetical protein